MGLKKLADFANNSTDRLREKRTKGREGVKKAVKSAYVLNGSPLSPDGQLLRDSPNFRIG